MCSHTIDDVDSWRLNDRYRPTCGKTMVSEYNKAIGCCHPNVYKLVTVLKGEQATTELTLWRADTGAPPPRRRRKYRDLDVRLDQYRQGQLTTDDYLTALRHVMHHYWTDNWHTSTDNTQTYMYGGGGVYIMWLIECFGNYYIDKSKLLATCILQPASPDLLNTYIM